MTSRRLPKWAALLPAFLIAATMLAFGAYESLFVSEVHGNRISVLGAVGLMLCVAAFGIAVVRRRGRSGRSYWMVMTLSGLTALLAIPGAAIAFHAAGGQARNDRLLARLEVGLIEVEPTGLERPSELESQESVRVFLSKNVERDCDEVITAVKEWWDGSASGRGGPDYCDGNAENRTQEVEIIGRDGRMVVRLSTRTADLFVF